VKAAIDLVSDRQSDETKEKFNDSSSYPAESHPHDERREIIVLKARVIASAVALLAGTTIGLIIPSTPAQASVADCSNGRNGFIDISDLEIRGTAHGSFTFPNGFGTITLLVGKFGGTFGDQRGYAQLAGGRFQGSSRVWMDWTQDGGHHWLQCGPFGNGHRPTNSPLTSAAQKTNVSKGWQFRACGDVPGLYSAKCAAWW
jgi:hypothetical protein